MRNWLGRTRSSLSDRLGAATRWRPILYLVGWALLSAAFVVGLRSFLAHPPPDRLARYSGEFLLFHAGFALIAAAIGLSLFMLAKHRRCRFLLGPILNSPLVVLAVLSGQLFAPNFQNPVCGLQAGCFALAVAPAIGDIAFEIWTAPSAYSLVWRRLETGIEMNYSEDGSYLSNPHLILSGNERLLVLARGGYLVDAIDVAGGTIRSEFVPWNAADRDLAMRGNSDSIQRLLDQNR